MGGSECLLEQTDSGQKSLGEWMKVARIPVGAGENGQNSFGNGQNSSSRWSEYLWEQVGTIRTPLGADRQWSESLGKCLRVVRIPVGAGGSDQNSFGMGGG